MPYDARYGLVPDGWTGPQASRSLEAYGSDAVRRGYNTHEERQQTLSKDRGFWGTHGLFKNAVLPTVAFAAAPFAVGALAGSGAAGGASVPGAVGASSAPLGVGTVTAGTAGSGMTLGNVWNLANLGVGTASSFMGQRANNRALDRQMQIQQREIDARLAADAEARAEAKRQFDANQENERRRLAAEDEERAYNRRILDEREARMVPRRAQADMARRRLAAFLGLR